MWHLLACLMLLPCVFGGSKCPPRSDIYPCICIDRPIGKSKFDTTVICRGLEDADSLMAIESALREMDINRFMLYDSYLPNGLRRQKADSRVPINILSSFKMEEIEVVDTGMSSFACPEDYNCRTNVLKRFTGVNTTMPERATCNNNGLTIHSWISCPGYLVELTINKGFSRDFSLKPDFFPEPMENLKVLRLSNNQISVVDRKTFSQDKFPNLETLDLSRNSLRDVRNLFTSKMPKLKTVDLSFNGIRNTVDFQYLPQLHTLKLNNNKIVNLLQSDWNLVPAGFRHLNITGNDLNCGCGIQFLNSTFHINSELHGECAAPVQVAKKKLRKAWRFLVERCDDQGNIGSKRKYHAPKQ